MYLYFNKNGTLTTQINHGEVPRQGANLDVHALVDLDFFEEQGDYHLDDWTALLKVVDTLGKTAVSGATMWGPKLITFVKSNNAEATFNLVNGQNYYAFDFLINSSEYTDVTALSGNIKIGVSFINTDSSLNVVGGECTLYIEPVLKDSYIKNNINPSQYRQLMSKIEQAEFYTTNNKYNNYSVSYNLVVNRNGYQVPNVKFETISIAQYSDYTVKQLRDNTTNTKIEDTSKIKEYLSAITGNERIPEYNESKPSDQFIICAVDNSMWKMQYDETNGLLAFKVENVPLFDTKQDKLTYTSSIDVNDICLYEHDEDPTSDGTDGRLENISGGLYFNGNPVASLRTTAGSEEIKANSATMTLVTRNTSQTITGAKTFDNHITLEEGNNGDSHALHFEYAYGEDDWDDAVIQADYTHGGLSITTSGIQDPDNYLVIKPSSLLYVNESGTDYEYSFPDASGTLALTSDLSNYVTTNTTQTGLSGNKTFVDSSIKIVHSSNNSNCTLINRSGIDIQYDNGSGLNKIELNALNFMIRSGSDTTIYRVGQISNKISSEDYAVLTLPTTSGELALKDDIPSTYIKSVSVSGNTLTLTKQDNTTEKFTPSSGGSGGGFTLLYSGSCNDIDGSAGTQIGSSGLYAISGYIDTEHLGTLIGSSYLNDKLFIEVIGGGTSRASSTIFPLTEDFGYYRFYGIWDDTIDGAIMGAHDEMNIYKLG